MNKHTKGPWTVRYLDESTFAPQVYGADGTVVATMAEISSVADSGADGEEEANAALIAAAPEMLAASETLIEALLEAGYTEFCFPGLGELMAAIAKATEAK